MKSGGPRQGKEYCSMLHELGYDSRVASFRHGSRFLAGSRRRSRALGFQSTSSDRFLVSTSAKMGTEKGMSCGPHELHIAA